MSETENTPVVSHAEALRAVVVDLRTRRDAAERSMHATDLPIDESAWSIYAYVVGQLEAALAIHSSDLRAFIAKCRLEANEESGGAWEAGYAHGLLDAADELAALLGDPVKGNEP